MQLVRLDCVKKREGWKLIELKAPLLNQGKRCNWFFLEAGEGTRALGKKCRHSLRFPIYYIFFSTLHGSFSQKLSLLSCAQVADD
jgi:hypothetical protein